MKAAPLVAIKNMFRHQQRPNETEGVESVGLFDIHCHLLPGVDDGSADMDTSLALLDREYADGVRTILLTPHYRPGMFENSEKHIRAAYAELGREAGKRFPDLVLLLGCELHSQADMTEKIQDREQFRMAGTDYVLVEFSSLDSQDRVRGCIFELLSGGYQPIIAHVERCACVVRDLEFARHLTELGAKLQVNADSVIGREGRETRRFCQMLMEQDLLFFIGSDAHDLKHRPPRMGECAEWLEKRMGAEYMRKILHDNPRRIFGAGDGHGI